MMMTVPDLYPFYPNPPGPGGEDIKIPHGLTTQVNSNYTGKDQEY